MPVSSANKHIFYELEISPLEANFDPLVSRPQPVLPFDPPPEGLIPFVPPPFHPATVAGRCIQGWMAYAGTYGMGGPGFLAFQLGEREWLMISLWGAADWVELNGAILSSYNQDEVSSMLVGSRIVSIAVSKSSFSMEVEGNLLFHIAESAAGRPIFPGTGLPRQLGPDEDLRLGVFLAPTPELWV